MARNCNRRSVQMRTSTMMLAAGLATSLAMIPSAAQAQTSTWALNGTGNWSSLANWDTVPVPGTTTGLVFNNFLLPLGYLSTNDIGNFAGITSLSFNNQATAPLGGAEAPNLRVAGGANTLTFDAAGATISQHGPCSVNISHLVTLAGGTTTISGAGNGGLAFTGNMTGNGDVVINRSGVGYTRFGSNGNTNTFTGTITLQNGGLDVGFFGNNTSLGSAANTLIVNGGDLRLVGIGTISNNITLNADLNLLSTRNGTFAGVISDGSGPRGINITSYASIGVNFSGTSTFSGAVNLLQEGTSRTSLNLRGASGAWNNVSTLNAFGHSTLILDNSVAVNNNRMNDAATINLHRANMQVIGSSTTNVAETLGTVNFDGQSTISLLSNATTPQAVTLTLGNLNRVGNGTLEIYGTFLGTNAPGTAGSSNLLVTGGVTGAIGGGGAAGSTNMSILPWVVGQNSTSTSAALGTNATFASFGVYDAAKGLRPLTASEMNSTSLTVNTATANQNMRPQTVIAGINSDRTVNSLTLSTATASSGFNASTYGNGTINVASGGVLFNLSGGNIPPTQSGTPPVGGPSVIGNNLNFGPAQGVVVSQSYEFGNMANASDGNFNQSGVIVGNISGSGGMVKTGNGVLLLAGNNTFTGGMTINSGQLTFNSDAALGAPGQPITLNGGGATNPNLTYSPNISWSNHGVQNVTINRPIILGPTGGSIGITGAINNASVSLAGQISGSGSLQIIAGGGTVYLSPNNTYTGGTSFQAGGNVSITDDSALGSGQLTLSQLGTLQIDGASPVNMNRNIQLLQTGVGRIQTNADLVLNGGLNVAPNTDTGAGNANFAGAGFTKLGAGTMTILGDSSMTGALTLGGTAPVFVGNQAQAVPAGTLRLAGNGALPMATSSTLTSNTEIVLDNSAINNNNRLSTGTVNLNGNANLTLIGNAAGTNEVIGTLNQSSSATNSGMGIVTVQPGAAGASLTGQQFSRSASALLLVRGNNLGAAPGANTANVFVGNNPSYVGNAVYGTTPAQVAVTGGSVMTGVIADSSNTGNGTDFATYSTATGVTPFTGYTALATNSVTANIADVTNAQSLTGAATNAGVRISAGGSIDTNGNALTLGGAGLTGMILTTANANITDTGGTGSIAFGASPGLIVNNGSLGMGSTLIGTAGLNKSGTGTLTFNTAPTLTGQYIVSQGSMVLGSGVTLPAAATTVVAGGATLDFGGNNQTLASIDGYGTYAIGDANLTLTGASANVPATLTGSGVSNLFIRGNTTLQHNNTGLGGSINVANGAVLTLAANQGAGSGTIFLGDSTATTATLTTGSSVTTIANNINVVAPGATSAAVTLNSSTAAVAHYTGAVTLNRQLTLNAGLDTFIDGVIQDGTTTPVGSGLNWIGGGIALTGANTFSSGTTINLATPGAGTVLGIGNDAAFGTGPITVASSFNLRADGGARTIANPITNTATAANSMNFVGMSPLTLSGAANLGTAKVTLASISPAPLTFSNTVTSTAAAGSVASPSIAKAGGGTIVFAGGGSIIGNVTVTGGTLLVNGNTPFSIGAGQSITVNANGILGGSGIVNGNVSVVANGILSPGNSPGIFTANGNTSLASNAYLLLELNGPNAGIGASDYDRYVANGTIGVGGANLRISLGYFPDVASDRFFVVDNDLSDAVTGTFAGQIEGSTVSLGTWGFTPITAQITYAGDLASGTVPGDALYLGGNDIVLYNIVPAPGAASLLAVVGIVSARRRRWSL